MTDNEIKLEKPKSIVLEVQSIRHGMKVTTKPIENGKKEEKKNG